MTRTRLAFDVTVDQSWWDDAACAGADPDLFHPGRGESGIDDADKAIAICQGCPVRQPCRAGARERRETQGIWGGEDFDSLRKKARARAKRREDKTRP